jgi:hypothetical protein
MSTRLTNGSIRTTESLMNTSGFLMEKPIGLYMLEQKTAKFGLLIRKKIEMAKLLKSMMMTREVKDQGQGQVETQDRNQDQDQDQDPKAAIKEDLPVKEEATEIETTMEEGTKSVFMDVVTIKEEMIRKDSVTMKACTWVKIEEKTKPKVVSVSNNKALETIEGGTNKEADKTESSAVTKDFVWVKFAMKAKAVKIVTKATNTARGLFFPRKFQK